MHAIKDWIICSSHDPRAQLVQLIWTYSPLGFWPNSFQQTMASKTNMLLGWAGCRGWLQRKKELSTCGCVLSCLFLGFFSSDSYFISQGWSLQLNVHPVYITCNKPRDSHTVLSSVSSSVTQQLEEIRVSSFSLALWQGNQISSLLLLSHLWL